MVKNTLFESPNLFKGRKWCPFSKNRDSLR